jgi:hypothetical protein
VVVDDFDVVAVGVEHVGGVVARVIVGALARRAVAAVAGRGRVGVEPSYASSEPSDAPTVNAAGSAAWRRIVSPAPAAIVA